MADIQTIQSKQVSIPRAGGRPMAAFQALPEGEGSFPGVIVIHEIFGLNDNIRDIVERFARQEYAALAVDLFSTGNRAVCLLRIFHGMILRPLRNGMLAELQTAVDYFRQQSHTDTNRVGVVGYCMGGTYALQLACTDEDLRVASVYYGMNPRPLEAVARACPIVGSYPEKDFTAKAARQLEEALKTNNVPHDIKIYDGAKHSFFNDQGAAYDEKAANNSWARTLSFFHVHLKHDRPQSV